MNETGQTDETDEMDQISLPLQYRDIEKILPHRYPFLLVDRITELQKGKRVVGLKNVTGDEPFFAGHFPGNPIMPGVLIIEAMAQVGGVLARLSVPGVLEKGARNAVYFMAMDKVKFRKPVVPGDQLKFVLEALRTGTRVWKMRGRAYVEENLVAEAELTATIG